MIKTLIRPAVVLLALFTLVTGLFYPLAVTGLAQVVFPAQANGSLLEQNGRVVGSALIGQPFDAPKYFWGRPSATSPFPYNAAASSGSNLGPSNPALTDAVQARIAALRSADPDNTEPVPADLVTASGSGLDPHISVAAALYQAPRVVHVRGLDAAVVSQLVEKYTEGPQLGLAGRAARQCAEVEPGVGWGRIDERPTTNDQ